MEHGGRIIPTLFLAGGVPERCMSHCESTLIVSTILPNIRLRRRPVAHARAGPFGQLALPWMGGGGEHWLKGHLL